MQGWHTTYLGMRELPREISTFEMQAFFTFEGAEREVIDARRSDPLKLGLALHIGFLRMSRRLLSTFRVVPPTLWRHLGKNLASMLLKLHRCGPCMGASAHFSIINKSPARPWDSGG
jgi:hypothetical protein